MSTITITVPENATSGEVAGYVMHVGDQISDGMTSGHENPLTHWDSDVTATWFEREGLND